MEAKTTTPLGWGSYEDAERMFGLSRWTFWRLAKAGHIRAAKVGGATRLDLDSIESYLMARADEYARHKG